MKQYPSGQRGQPVSLVRITGILGKRTLREFESHLASPYNIWRGGRVWLIATVLKTVGRDERPVGSNPTPSARIAAHFYGDGDYVNQSWQSEETTKNKFQKPLDKYKIYDIIQMFKTRKNNTKLIEVIDMKKIFGVVMLIIIWQIGSMMTTPLFIPSPLATWEALIGLIQTGQLWSGLLYSFTRISTATLLSVTTAIPIALLIYAVRPLKDMISPVVSAMRYIPVTAFSPLLILWFGIDETMKISFLFLATFVYVLPSTVLCLEEVPQDLIDTGKSIGMKAYEIIFEILLPAALPSIMNSILMMYGIGWTYVAVVEETNAIKGLGFIINVGSARGKTAVVFAAILIIIVFSYIFDKFGHIIIKKLFKWRYMNNDNAA